MKMNPPRSLRRFGFVRLLVGSVFAFALAAPVAVRAASVQWNGFPAGTSTNWSNTGSWAGGVVPTSSDDAKFFDTGTNALAVINNFVDASANLASLTYGNSNGFHTTLIAPGQTLTVSGAGGLTVGAPISIGTARNLTNAITGAGGSLVVNNSAANIAISQGNVGTAVSATRANLDMSGLDNFTANISRLGLGTTVLPAQAGGNQSEAAQLILAKTNVIILNYSDTLANYQLANKTNALEMSRNPGNNASILSLLLLGNTNFIGVDSLGIGRDKASANSAGVIAFNPAVVANSPQAVFRNADGASRVTWWAIGDMNANASSSQVAVGTNDFSGGRVDALVNVMSLARDCSPSHTATAFIFGVLTFTAGTVDVNTIYAGNQAVGPSGSSTPLTGIINVNGANATLVVNNNLVLGNTTQNSTAAQRTTGVLNVKDGTVRANQITIGAQPTNSVIAMTNGLLVVSNTVASPAKALTTLNLTNSTLQLNVTGITNIAVTNLTTGGATNIINPASVAVFSSYPTQLVLIKYFAPAVGGVGFNFGFGANTLPPTAPSAYLSNNVANKSIDLVLPCDPRPLITSQPSSYSGNPGDNVTFTAGIGSCSVTPLSYQWYLGTTALTDGATGNGSTRSGSTTASLSITSAQPGDNGSYTLIVTNIYGSATSTPPAVLTISSGCVPPSISAGPNDTTVIQSNNATFSATISGSPLPDLQWRRAGVDIPGATTASYTLTNAQYPADDQIVFCLVATNTCGTVTNCATLTVIVPPTLSCQPTNLTVTVGQPASFLVCASGVPAPGYQWRKNNSPITGATSSALNFASADPTNAAVYDCVVANAAGSVTTTGATLLVNSTMSVSSLSPANSATGICPDTILKITFDRAPVLGTTGKVRVFNVTNSATPVDTIDLSLNNGAGSQSRTVGGASYNTYPVLISGNTASIFPHAGVLTTNQTYYVLVDDVLGGFFKDTTGATFAGISATNVWQFSTKPTGPANPTNVVVAADGSGDFCTVQGAIDSIASGNVVLRTISIRNGFYQEIVFINGRNNLTLIGQNRDLTQIGYPNNDVLNGGTSLRPSFRANGNDNAIVNLTLTNSTPKGGSQAEALRTDGKRIIIFNSKLASYQDTMLNNNNGDLVYVQDTLIQGDTDFIWGGGTTFLTNCEIRTLSSGTQITQARTAAITNGFSFNNCLITRSNSSITGCGFGRDLGFTDNNVAFIRCIVGDHITGWANPDPRDWEYGLTNSSGSPTQYNGVQLASNDPRLLLAQSATNWLYGWRPQLAPVFTAQPANQAANVGDSASFSATAIGIGSPSYQWTHAGTNLPGATSATLSIPVVHGPHAGAYAVIASNGAGSVTSATVTLTVPNQPPTATPATFSRKAGFPLKIAVPDIAAVCSDTDFDVLFVSGVTASTNGATVSFDSAYVYYVNGNDVTDQFGYTINDGRGGTSNSTITIVIAPPSTNASLNITGQTLNNDGTVTIGFAGVPGYTYVVEATTNLSAPDWLPLETNVAGSNGLWQFTDLDAPNHPQRYYRSRKQ